MASTDSESARPGQVTLAGGYIPVIDLAYAYSGSPDHRTLLTQAIAQACQSSGFFIASGHQVPHHVIAEMLRATARFFALPAETKLALLAHPADPLMRGYSWPARPRDGDAADALLVTPDLSESFVVNRLGDPRAAATLPEGADERLTLRNPLPDLPGFRAAYDAYYAEMERLAMDIMRLFARALQLPAEWFDDKFDQHMTSLAANFYPPQTTPPKPGQLRKGAHTDWGTLTVLYQDETTGGLQVWSKAQGWVDVPTIPGTFVVNIGDLMALWTNDTWASTVHRVVNPPRERALRQRYSLAFFHQPNYDALITCIPSCEDPEAGVRHRPVQSFDYIAGKARRAYLEDRIVARRSSTPAR
jgi:isopenicillin N synthase-like dioxygenase